MKVDGKALAEQIFINLATRVKALQKHGITPHLAVILVGENPASVSYVKRKEKKASEIGAKATVINLELRITNEELRGRIEKLNQNSNIHGVIIQRPLPQHIDNQMVNQTVDLQKDIDGFSKNSPFIMPLAQAVLFILEHIFLSIKNNQTSQKFDRTQTWSKEFESRGINVVNLRGCRSWQTDESFISWLKEKNIVVIGKGQTGGGPTISLLKKLGIEPTIIDSKTENVEDLTRSADIMVSAIGKSGVIKPEMLKKGVVLVGVGMHKGEDGKMHGDYDEEEIKNIASYYTPIPGGVGPVNVAMLLSNLIQAAETQTNP